MKKKYTNPSIEVCEIDNKCIMIDTSVPGGDGDPAAKGTSLDFQSDDADEDDLGW